MLDLPALQYSIGHAKLSTQRFLFTTNNLTFIFFTYFSNNQIMNFLQTTNTIYFHLKRKRQSDISDCERRGKQFWQDGISFRRNKRTETNKKTDCI